MLVCILSKLGNTNSDWYLQLRSRIGGHAIVVDDVMKLNTYSLLQRISDGGIGNNSVSLPIILIKIKVNQMLPSSYISSLLVSFL